MRVSLIVATAVIIGAAVWPPASQSSSAAADTSSTCSNATLQGSYGFTSLTLYPADTPKTQNAWGNAGRAIITVGRMEFDGKGGWRSSYTASLADGQRVTENRTGGYSVSEDCFGSIHAAMEKGGTHFLMVTESAGRELRFIGGHATGSGFKQDAR